MYYVVGVTEFTLLCYFNEYIKPLTKVDTYLLREAQVNSAAPLLPRGPTKRTTTFSAFDTARFSWAPAKGRDHDPDLTGIEVLLHDRRSVFRASAAHCMPTNQAKIRQSCRLSSLYKWTLSQES